MCQVTGGLVAPGRGRPAPAPPSASWASESVPQRPPESPALSWVLGNACPRRPGHPGSRPLTGLHMHTGSCRSLHVGLGPAALSRDLVVSSRFRGRLLGLGRLSRSPAGGAVSPLRFTLRKHWIAAVTSPAASSLTGRDAGSRRLPSEPALALRLRSTCFTMSRKCPEASPGCYFFE